MEPATSESASNQLSSVRNYVGGFSRQKRRELQNQFETGLQWLEQEPPDFDQALRLFARCMKSDPMGAVYTYEFLQTLEAGYQKGLYCHGWRQRRGDVAGPHRGARAVWRKQGRGGGAAAHVMSTPRTGRRAPARIRTLVVQLLADPCAESGLGVQGS